MVGFIWGYLRGAFLFFSFFLVGGRLVRENGEMKIILDFLLLKRDVERSW